MTAITQRITAALDRVAAGAAGIPRHKLAWGGLALAAITLLAVNLIASSALRDAKLDLTRDRLFTISDGTRKALRGIDEPIDVRVYYSKRLGEAAPTFAKNFERVRSLLEQYRDISRGKLQVAFHDPEPFSDAEDRAVAAGLRGVRLNQEGDTAYFGIVGTNSTDNEASIAFFASERERFLEYDVTKLVHTLANPKKRVIGLISSIPLEGGMAPPMMGMGGPRQIPPLMVAEQIREFFDIKTINKDATEIPSDVGVLMLVQPEGLSREAAYAVDQFALGGGKVLAFVDPVPEMQRTGPMMMPSTPDIGEFDKLLKAWGVTFDPSKVAADISHARRVQFGGGQRGGSVTEYVAWLGLDKRNFDERDVLSGGIERMNFASAGMLAKVDGATTDFAPIVKTSPNAMQIGAERVGMMPDAVGLLRGYKPGGTSLTLAARVSGEAKSAFADGAPKPEPKPEGAEAPEAKDPKAKGAKKAAGMAAAKAEKAAEPTVPVKPHVASGKINAVIIADTDFLHDQFWVDVREFLGQQVAIPNAHNSAFVLGALENLSGSDALISLRGRGVSDRPFELVNDLRRDAERRFRDKEQALTAKLKEVQDQLAKLEKASDGENVVLTDKDRQQIEKFRSEMLGTRRELREVKRELRKDIDRLDGTLKFVNIAVVPLLIGVGGIGLAVYRRRRANAKEGAGAQP